MAELIKLTISQVLADLASGLDRKQLREKYKLSHADMAKLFKDPKLANKKPLKAAGFILTDDTTTSDTAPSTTADIAQEGTASETSEAEKAPLVKEEW